MLQELTEDQKEAVKEKTEKEAQLEEKMDRWMYLTDLVEQIESQK